MECVETKKEQPKGSRCQREGLVIAIVYGATIFMSITATILSPFYPKEANRRNISASQYGFIIGIYDIVPFLSGVPVGNLAYRCSPRSLFVSGIFLLIISAFAFGCLTLTQDGLAFLLLSLVCRIAQGLTKSLINVTMLATFPVMFPENSAFYISWGEFISGIGEILGPAIGGPLYNLGGFGLPFFAVSLSSAFLLPIAIFFLPSVYSEKKNQEGGSLLWNMFKMGRMWICFGCSGLIDSYITFLVATFEPGIQFLKLSSAEVGLIFASMSIGYAFFIIILGKFCDLGVNPLWFVVLGGFFGAGGAVILAFSQAVYQLVIGLLIIGVGHAGLFLPSLVYITKLCLLAGFPDSIETHGLLSGYFMASISLGAFLGPTVGGFIFDAIGFRLSNLIYFGLHLLAGFIVSIFLLNDACQS